MFTYSRSCSQAPLKDATLRALHHYSQQSLTTGRPPFLTTCFVSILRPLPCSPGYLSRKINFMEQTYGSGKIEKRLNREISDPQEQIFQKHCFQISFYLTLSSPKLNTFNSFLKATVVNTLISPLSENTQGEAGPEGLDKAFQHINKQTLPPFQQRHSV